MKKEFPFRVLFTDKNAMKKTLLFLLALALCLSGCGRQQVQEAPPPVPEVSEAPVYAAPDAAAPAAPAWRYQSVPITADNWTEYFALSELPLYAVTSDGSISQVCQNYCVVLRDEYAPLLRPDGDYNVTFTVSFDLYVNTLEIDTEHYSYRHTDDLLYATQATKTAVFDKNALPLNAYGNRYENYRSYSNAFFVGWAQLDPVNEVWSGFQIDLTQVRILSVEGELQLVKQ